MSAYKTAFLIGIALGAAYLVIQLAPLILIATAIVVFLRLEKADQESKNNNEK